MTVVTLRPTSTIGNTGTLTGGASLHAVLSDDSDASYVTFVNGQDGQVHLTDLSLPAGNVIKSVAVRARLAKVSSNTILRWRLFTGAADPYGGVRSTAVSWSAPLTITLNHFYYPPFTDAQVDDTRLSLDCSLAAGLRVYEAYVDVVHVPPPTVTVTAPAGTVTNTNRPVVQYTPTLDPDGGPQTHWQIKIFTAAQYGAGGFDPYTSAALHDSGIQQGFPIGLGAGWAPPTPLPDGAYRAYVRVAQTVTDPSDPLWSAWSFSQFTIDVDLPAVPSLTATAQNTAGRIMIALADNAGAATTNALELQRSTDGGVSWRPVRSQEGTAGILLAADPTVYDYEALIGASTQYRARALHDYSGVYAASAWATAATAIDSADWWLKHPRRPALNLALRGDAAGGLLSYRDVQRAARQGVFQALGASRPLVVSDTRGGPTGTIVLQLRASAARDALNALLDSTEVLLLHGPVSDGHPDRYVKFGDHASDRLIDKGTVDITRETLTWVQVDAPDGAQTGAQYVASEGEEELVFA